ncbi:UDP-N-acetylmuramoyl-tripeptide--D-alanyl-D-alanine ligase [Clostridia bacterium]|nr:UDP-N-acetylmuramoyl-tripeptide--D-alanyl-D-alanine ligase [Clostridia bacterium]
MSKERTIGTVREIAQLLGCDKYEEYGRDQISSVVTDSRAVVPGALFFAIRGERTDGHLYLTDILKKEGSIAIVEKGHKALKELDKYSTRLIPVENVLDAMHQLARWYRKKFNIPVVAVTGSSGKTTTKDMVRDVLSQSFKVKANHGSFNNELGLPLTILGLAPEHQVLVLEMGMRGLGQIEKLCDIALPTIGIITNIGLTHMELLKTQENIFRAKTELLLSIPQDGICILNGTDQWTNKAKTKCNGQVLTYGFSESDSIQAKNILQEGTSTIFDVTYQSQSHQCRLPLLGKHNVLDALSAILVGLKMGMSLDVCVHGIENLKLSDKRLSYQKGVGNSQIINDCYNANPDSMSASLGILEMHPGRKIAVLADMRELGEIEQEEHRKIGRMAAQKGVALLVGVGPLAKYIVEGANDYKPGMAIHCINNDEAAEYLLTQLKLGDTVLVKGSRSMKLEEIIDKIVNEDNNE